MLKKLIAIFLICQSCSSEKQSKNEFERFRETLVENNIIYQAEYKIDSKNSNTLETEIFYNDKGYATKMVSYASIYSVDFIEEYFYTSENVLVEIKRGKTQDSLKTTYKAFLNDKKEIETEYEYYEDGSVYKSIYKNDSIGRNQSKEYYKDSILVSTFKFEWYDTHKLSEIRRYNIDNKLNGKELYNYKDGLLLSKLRIEHDTIIESEKYEYNSLNLLESIIFEVPKNLRIKTELTYDNGLIKKEVTDYLSLKKEIYKNTETRIREYKKH